MNWLFRLIIILISFSAFAAPSKDEWEFWAVSNEASDETISHDLWDNLLNRYVLTDHQSEINRFAYRQVSGEDQQSLKQYTNNLSQVDIRTHNKREQMSYWINLYNALTVQVVLRYPEEGSILEMGDALFSTGPWDDVVITVNQQALTLNDIEHRILRSIFDDHRVHFALNCASLGCPNLATNAYRSKNLEAMLVKGEADYLNHSRGVSFEGKDLVLSSLFDWYQGDFAENEDLLRRYLASHLEGILRDKVLGYRGSIRYRYDWKLNEPAAQVR